MRVRRWFIANHGMTFHAYTRLETHGPGFAPDSTRSPPSPKRYVAHGYESEKSFREAFSARIRQSTIGRGPGVLYLDQPGRHAIGFDGHGCFRSLGLCLLEFAERRMLDTQLKRLRQRLGRVFSCQAITRLMQQVKIRTRRLFRQQSPAIHRANPGARKQFPGSRLAGSDGHSVRRNAQLRGSGGKNRPAICDEGGRPRQRRQSHLHHHPLPPCGRLRWQTHRIRRRPVAQGIPARTRTSPILPPVLNCRSAAMRANVTDG